MDFNKEIEIDFQVLRTFDPKSIVVADTSYWGMLVNKPSIIEVTLPGEVKPIVNYYEKNRLNILNSFNLGLKCPTCGDLGGDTIDLPDGIYHIVVKGSPESINKSRYFLKYDKIQLKLDTYISTLDLNYSDISDEIIKRLQKITIYLEAAESNVRLGNICEGQELLFKAQKALDKLISCKTCV